MATVRLLVSRASALGPQNRGDLIEVSQKEAKSLIAAGHAEYPRTEEQERATHVATAVETAVRNARAEWEAEKAAAVEAALSEERLRSAAAAEADKSAQAPAA